MLQISLSWEATWENPLCCFQICFKNVGLVKYICRFQHDVSTTVNDAQHCPKKMFHESTFRELRTGKEPRIKWYLKILQIILKRHSPQINSPLSSWGLLHSENSLNYKSFIGKLIVWTKLFSGKCNLILLSIVINGMVRMLRYKWVFWSVKHVDCRSTWIFAEVTSCGFLGTLLHVKVINLFHLIQIQFPMQSTTKLVFSSSVSLILAHHLKPYWLQSRVLNFMFNEMYKNIIYFQTKKPIDRYV